MKRKRIRETEYFDGDSENTDVGNLDFSGESREPDDLGCESEVPEDFGGSIGEFSGCRKDSENFEDNSRESDDNVGDLYGGDGGSDDSYGGGDSNDRESIQSDDIDGNSRELDDNVGGDGDPGDLDGGGDPSDSDGSCDSGDHDDNLDGNEDSDSREDDSGK